MTIPPYVLPEPAASPFPQGLSLNDFLQTVIVGVSGVSGNLVRPRWQPEPPKQPDLNVNWIGLGVESSVPDASAYVALNQQHEVTTVRYEDLALQIACYGPNNLEVYGVIRDGFQLPQNRIALYQANMAFVEISAGRRIPDLVNQRWIDRVECTVRLRRRVQRDYPILTFVSATGKIYVPDVSEGYEINWEVSPPEEA